MSEFTKNQVHKQLERAAEEARAMAEKMALESAFADFDFDTLPKMTSKDLAAWQAKYPMNSPQYIIASQEWNRRALVDQINATKWSAIMGLVGVIIGVILTALFTWFLSPDHRDNQIQKQTINQTSTQGDSGNKTKIIPPVSQKP